MQATNFIEPANAAVFAHPNEHNTIRTSERLRNKSVKGAKDPNPIVDDSNLPKGKKFELLNIRLKSASCSNLDSIDGSQLKEKKSKKGKAIGKQSSECKDNKDGKQVSSSSSTLWHEKQTKLSQQRIDILLKSTSINNNSCQHDNSLFRSETCDNLSAFESNLLSLDQRSQLSIAESFVSTIEEPLEEDINTGASTKKQPFITMAGKETELPNSIPVYKQLNEPPSQPKEGMETPDDWKSFMIQIQRQINENTNSKVDGLRADFNAGLDQMQQTQEKLRSDLDATTTTCNTNERELIKVQGDLQTCKIKLEAVNWGNDKTKSNHS